MNITGQRQSLILCYELQKETECIASIEESQAIAPGHLWENSMDKA